MQDFINETNNRRLIRELIDDYAFYADSCEVQKQADLFTADTVYIVEYLDNPDATQTIIGKDNLVPLFEQLTTFHTKTHFNGQNKILTLNEQTATGIVYCMAHHISFDETGKQNNMVASIRYDDEYRQENGVWLFAKRHLKINWVENRSF
ncbi:hypothetical protein MHD_06735 [Mannheimia granulomatis]|uniref:SnoaL-like domain-containing protein n=1 Tax=Mannheimia granulomatis TaxID=85402 RepID=A0A011NEP9_9PAST|nr:nuclear transport factor 2 family protein [Mannheimia granulomatis]EXI62885.1 hypothetical protein AK33_03465 [Mannheimia granulomatis]RGE48171.1 hypothetical protein MHD_06735 [Mannheimia granulomatis]